MQPTTLQQRLSRRAPAASPLHPHRKAMDAHHAIMHLGRQGQLTLQSAAGLRKLIDDPTISLTELIYAQTQLYAMYNTLALPIEDSDSLSATHTPAETTGAEQDTPYENESLATDDCSRDSAGSGETSFYSFPLESDALSESLHSLFTSDGSEYDADDERDDFSSEEDSDSDADADAVEGSDADCYASYYYVINEENDYEEDDLE